MDQKIVYTLYCLAFTTIAIILYRSYKIETEYWGEKENGDTKIAFDLRLIHPLAPEVQTDIDIIAVHGLNTKSPDTWEYKDSKTGNVIKNWLRDADMLPSKIGRARVFTCDWPSETYETSNMAQRRIEQIAKELINGLKRRPTSDDNDDKRPILFIASCLGGVILMKALTEAKENDPILLATRGVIFLATPFYGTAFAKIAYLAKPAMSLIAWFGGTRVTALSNVLFEPSFEVTSIARKFAAFQRKYEVPHTTFHETAPTNLLKKNLPSPFNKIFRKEEILVNESTGALPSGFEEDALELTAKHQFTNKFWGPEDPDYRSVSGVVEGHLKRIRQGMPLERMDLILREQEYTKECLQILRLSGLPLPIDRCYINLALLEQSGEEDYMPPQGQGAKVPSPFSLTARLGVETPDENKQVKIPNIFGGHTDPHNPRKVLIRGRAGVGKTTLCKKIVHDFVHGDLWKYRFDRIFWLPLRELKSRKHNHTRNIQDLIYNQYLYDKYDGEKIAREAWGAMHASGYRNTLFLLDGLDEISDELNEENGLLTLLMKLPHIIVTSRPDVTLPRWLRANFSLELEAIGFYPEQVKTYVTQYFDDSDIDESKRPEQIEQILSFLQKHQLIQSLMRIPIQLDALCWTWNLSDLDGSQPQTMTDIYCAIEDHLWKKDEPNLRFLRDSVRQRIYDKFSRSSTATFALERLAFAGMYSNIINFEPLNCKNAFEPKYRNRAQLTGPFDEVLSKTSFLRSSRISSSVYSNRDMRTYHFLHLTFQEFFAARYFARQWQAKEDLQFFDLVTGENVNIAPEALLGKTKYSTRYNIVWRFVAGLLDREQSPDGMVRLFSALDKAPLDILGSIHQRLTMHCLAEVKSAPSSLRCPREELLSKWLLLQIKLIAADQRRIKRDVVTLASEIEFPETILRSVLENLTDIEHKIIALDSLKKRHQLSPQMMNSIISLLNSSNSVRLKKCLIKILGRMEASLPEETIRCLTMCLASKEEGVRHSAAMAMQSITLAPTTCREIIARMIVVPVTSYTPLAAIVLRGQSLPTDMLISIAETLQVNSRQKKLREAAGNILYNERKGDSRKVREAAENILYHQRKLPPEVMDLMIQEIQNVLPQIPKSGPIKVLCGQLRELGKGANSWTTSDNETNLARLRRLSDELLEEALTGAASPCYAEQANQLKAWCDLSRLSEKALESRVEMLGNEPPVRRRGGIEILAGQSQLAPSILSEIADRLEDDDLTVRNTASDALSHQPSLPAETALRISSKFVQKDSVKIAALQAFEHRCDSTTEILTAIAGHIGDTEPSIKLAVLNALAGQSELLNMPNILDEIITCLQDDDEGVIEAAIRAIGACHPSTRKEKFNCIAARLGHFSTGVRLAAVKALGKEPNLPQNMVEDLIDLLDDKDRGVREAVVKCIDYQSIWPEGICRKLASRINDPRIIKLSSSFWLLERSIYNRREFHSNILLSGAAQHLLLPLLLLSFNAQLAWYIVDGESCLEKGTDFDKQPLHVQVGIDIEEQMRVVRRNFGVPPICSGS